MSESNEDKVNVLVTCRDGKSIIFSAGRHPFELVDGHLQILDEKGWMVALFAPGEWTGASVKDE